MSISTYKDDCRDLPFGRKGCSGVDIETLEQGSTSKDHEAMPEVASQRYENRRWKYANETPLHRHWN